MLGTVDSLDTSFAGPRNLVKKRLPTIPPTPPFSKFFFLGIQKEKEKGVEGGKNQKLKKVLFVYKTMSNTSFRTKSNKKPCVI
jgi:hypothetical protein